MVVGTLSPACCKPVVVSASKYLVVDILEGVGDK